MENLSIFHSFYSGFRRTAINVTGDASLTINFFVFDLCSAESAPAISFMAQSFTSNGLCAYRCEAITGTLSFLIVSNMKIQFLSIEHCGTDRNSGDDSINLWQGPVELIHVNVSSVKVKGASGFQIVDVKGTKNVLVRDVTCTQGSSGHVIEYNEFTIETTFENLIVCNNICSTTGLFYNPISPKRIFCKNCYFETPNNCDNFIKNNRDKSQALSFHFDNTYFCGNNFGDGVTGFIPTNSLLTPSIEAGYQTYLCEGALKNKELKTKRPNLQIDKLIPVILFQGSMFQCFNVSLEGVIPE